MPDETYRMYREACWHLGIEFDPKLYDKFLDSKQFESLRIRLKAEAYYTASNWIKIATAK